MQRLLLTYFVVCLPILMVSTSSVRFEDEHPGLNTRIKEVVKDILNDTSSTLNLGESNPKVMQEVKHLRSKVTSMETQLEDQSKTIAELQEIIQTMQKGGIEELDKETAAENQVMTDGIIDHTEVDNANGNRVPMSMEKIISQGRRVRRAVVGNVAFSVYLSTTDYHTQIGQVIKFDRILLNDGHGYNQFTGAFTAPLAGVYLFSFHFDTTKLTFVRLVVNNVNLVDAVANQHLFNNDRSKQSMGGNSAIVRVEHGQAVRVETFEVSGGATASSDNFHFCTFSGVLLY